MARHKHKLSTCPNCDHALEPHYDYCPSCGQENHDIRVPIGHIGYEFVEGITHFDTKLWNTLKYYFTRPGQMTKEYLDGKRARFVPAPRLYIFVSVVFFLILSQLSHISADRLKSKLQSDKKVIQVEVDNKVYKLDNNDAKYLLCLDDTRGDSLLLANENPLVSNYEIIRRAFRDSLVQHIKYSKKGKLSKALREMADDLRDTTETEDEGLSFDLEISTDTFVVEKSKPIKADTIKKDSVALFRETISKDSLETLKEIAAVDSMYLGQNCKNLNVYTHTEFFGNQYSKQEIALIPSMTDHQIDSLILSKDSTANAFWHRAFLRNVVDLEEGNFNTWFTKSSKALSFAMFLFMPLIAFVTIIFFRKKRKYYVEHLIFSLHIHTFLFIILGICGAIYLFADIIVPWYLIMTLFVVYIIISSQVVFENSWIKTIFKFFLIGLIYTFFLAALVTIILIIGALI